MVPTPKNAEPPERKPKEQYKGWQLYIDDQQVQVGSNRYNAPNHTIYRGEAVREGCPPIVVVTPAGDQVMALLRKRVEAKNAELELPITRSDGYPDAPNPLPPPPSTLQRDPLADLPKPTPELLEAKKKRASYRDTPCACCGKTGESAGTPPKCLSCGECNPTRGLIRCAPTTRSTPNKVPVTWSKKEAPTIYLPTVRFQAAAKSYSADKIAEWSSKAKNTIRTPFDYAGSYYVATSSGYFHREGNDPRQWPPYHEAWEMVEKHLYTGEPCTYDDMAGLRQYRHAKNAPILECIEPERGYEGVMVRWNSKIYCLTRPVRVAERQPGQKVEPEVPPRPKPTEEPADPVPSPSPSPDLEPDPLAAEYNQGSTYQPAARVSTHTAHRIARRRPRKLYILDEPPNTNCLRCLGERLLTYGPDKGKPCPACMRYFPHLIPKGNAA